MNDEDDALVKKFSMFWFCPYDGVKFTEYQPSGFRGVSGSPYFIVTRNNQALDIENAKHLRKISDQQVEFAMTLATDMFAALPPESQEITLVSVKCPTCGTRSIAPKLSRIVMDDAHLKKFKKTLKRHLASPSMTSPTSSMKDQRRSSSPLSFIWRLWYLYILLGFVVSVVSVIISQYLGNGGKLLP